jgi:hypothetical protein
MSMLVANVRMSGIDAWGVKLATMIGNLSSKGMQKVGTASDKTLTPYQQTRQNKFCP